MATVTEKQLGQLRPANTTAASLYSPPASTTALLTVLSIANTTADEAKFRLFIDDDGTTYDETTAIAWDVRILAETFRHIKLGHSMNDSSGNFAVRTDTNSALTFTLSGEEVA